MKIFAYIKLISNLLQIQNYIQRYASSSLLLRKIILDKLYLLCDTVHSQLKS